ncbi:MAG: ROK family protein [Marinilabiliaceae bacterium]|nr:ROK family protein [Marinilabiliaceae bacterium]
MKQIAIGIDIGGTNTKFGVVDNMGNVIISDSMDTPTHGDVYSYITDLSSELRKMIKSIDQINPETEIFGIGIGAPNANYYTGTIEHPANLSFKGVVPFVELLKKEFPEIGVITITNDANAAAIGEMIYGGAKGMKNFVMYTLGTGVGSGIVVNGNLVYGNDGFAGEIGHTMLIPGGRKCGCGKRGHLEAYCSATGIKRTAFELLSDLNATDSLLANKTYEELTSRMIFEAAQKGDFVAQETFKLTGKYLGQGLADTVHYLSPEAIFIFGGPTAAGEFIFEPAKQSMEEHLLPVFRNKVKVLPSGLKAGDAAILGSSALVWKEVVN